MEIDPTSTPPATLRIASEAIWRGEGEPRPGVVVIEVGKIAAVEETGDADVDLGETLLCAGLVNSHCHLDLTIDRAGETLETPFDDWLRGVVETRANLGDAGLIAAASGGIDALIAGGATAVIDIDPAGHSVAALADSPLRRLLLREVIAFGEDGFPDFEELAGHLSAGADNQRELRGLSPHSPYTVHPALLADLVSLCESHQAPWAMHVGEPSWEEELLVEGSGPGADLIAGAGGDPREFRLGQTIIDELNNRKLLSPRSLMVHGNASSEREHRLLAEAGCALVWCPRSHDFFGRGPHRAIAAATYGLRVLLGTDGHVSAGDLSMVAEIARARSAAPALPAELFWRMAVTHPRDWFADAGHPEFLGSGRLQPGDPADLVAIAIDGDASRALESALAGEVVEVWIDGVPQR